ncbi:hypothetical protein HID58_033945 [Brassica napus]|uniref:Uncharacterized protein n=1 Tax=Brassica napus TaxID=3708 RepID=A0ABQ8C0N4_BRANA|nr:hypothetical protein HID58_033945 [Brassica napus]
MALSIGIFITGHRKTDLGGTALVSWLRKLRTDCACAEKMNGSCVFLAAQSLCLFATRKQEDTRMRRLEATNKSDHGGAATASGDGDLRKRIWGWGRDWRSSNLKLGKEEQTVVYAYWPR